MLRSQVLLAKRPMALRASDSRSCGVPAGFRGHGMQGLVVSSSKRVSLRAAAAACLLGLAEPCSAGLLDGLRAIDINDYAVGIGVSTTENIYADAGDSQTVYPYLTKLVPSALDDGVTFGRDGAYGVRWLSKNGLEIAGS